MAAPETLTMILRAFAYAVVVSLSLTTLTQAGGQAPASQAPDVVSIRPVPPKEGLDAILAGGVRAAGGRLWATNSSVHTIVHAAYESEFPYADQIVSQETWVKAEWFDVDIRSAVPFGAPTEGVRLSRDAATLLQGVLQDRFRLRTRRETRELPRLVLTYARADRQLKSGIRQSDQNCTGVARGANPKCETRPLPGKYSARGRSLSEFLSYLSRPAYAGGTVIDGTGITGALDIDLEWELDFKDLLMSQGHLMAAVQQQLGLKIEAKSIAMPVLVIEDVQRPSAN